MFTIHRLSQATFQIDGGGLGWSWFRGGRGAHAPAAVIAAPSPQASAPTRPARTISVKRRGKYRTPGGLYWTVEVNGIALADKAGRPRRFKDKASAQRASQAL